jgi:hypothetical protein
MITGYPGTIEDIHFVLREDLRENWTLGEFGYKPVFGPEEINGEPVIKLLSSGNDYEIVVEDRLGEYGRYKYWLQVRPRNGGEPYKSDPELQNVREVKPNP